MGMQLDVIVGLLIVGVCAVSDSFACSWDPFPPTRLLHPTLISAFVPGLIVASYAMFTDFPVDLGKRGGGWGPGRSGRRGN